MSDNETANQPHELFRGVARWPCINDAFTGESFRILADYGITAWLGVGGRRGHDGRLEFGGVSSPALETLEAVETVFGGFRWTDEAGGNWVVRLVGTDDHDDRLAYAVTHREQAWLLDAEARCHAISALDIQLANCDQPARSWDEADRARYARLARRLYRLKLVDGAEQILMYLRNRTRAARRRDVFVSADELAAEIRTSRETTCPGPPLDAILHSTMGFVFAKLRLGRLGWDPRVVCQATAVTSVEKCDFDVWRVCTTPLLDKVIRAFG